LSNQPQTTEVFQKDSNDEILPTIENFYKFCSQKKLMGVKCAKCSAIFALPRTTCPKCHSTSMKWIEFKGTGKLLSYSIVYVSTAEYQSQTPYAVGIVELDEGARISGVVRNIKHEDLKIGLKVIVDFEANTSQEWPQWPRYFFRSS